MGNETSFQVHRYPVLAYEAPSRHSQTTASLPDSLAFCAQQDDFIRRQESLPSEADYTDSSDNSIISRRRQFPGATNNSNNPAVSLAWLRTTPGTCGTPSSEKGSLLDVLVKRISGGGQNLTSSSDEDQTGGTRDLSSATSLQDSACDFLESSQQLTEEEKAQIKGVLDRVKQVENREAKRISNLELELQQREAEAARRVVRSAQDIYGSVGGCNLCDSPATVNEMEGKDVKIRQCSDCERLVCPNCSFMIEQSESKDPQVICSLCRRKRRLIATSGAWTQGISFAEDELPSLTIPRVHSYGGYGDFCDAKSIYSRWKVNEKRLSTPKLTFTNPFKRPDSTQQTQDVPLPTITVDSPKSLQFPDLIAAQNDSKLHRSQHTVSGFEEEENLPSSDSECPDTEGVKSLFLPNRISPSPVNTFREPPSTDFDNHVHLSYTDEIMAVYYSDPWAYYGREIVGDVSVDEPMERDHGESYQLDDPPFGPISEEGEEEVGEMQQSFSDTSVTTTTPSTFEDSKPPSKPISRHLSLEDIPKIRRVLDHSYSYPLLATIYPGKNIFLSKVPQDMADFVRCETLSSLKGGLCLDPVSVREENNLQRVQVDDPPEIFVDAPFQQTYVTASWNHCSPLEEESARIIVADDDEEEDEDEDEGASEDREVKPGEISGLPQIRRCQHFENINQLIATGGSSLYPVMEEENGVESDLCLNSPITCDGQTIHRWGREIAQAAPSALDTTSSFTLTPYATDQVLIKQEEQLWSSLFAPSESAVVESAKGFTAQLQEMSQLVEVTVDEVVKRLDPTCLERKAQERVGNIDMTPPNEPLLNAATVVKKPHSSHLDLMPYEDANEEMESLERPVQPSLLREICETSANLDSTITVSEKRDSDSGASTAYPKPPCEQARQSPTTQKCSATDTLAHPDTPRGVTDIPRETGYRSVGGGRAQPMAHGQAHEVGGMGDSSRGCSGSEDSSSTHRPKVVSPPPPPPPLSPPPPTPHSPPPPSPPPACTTHYPSGEGCNVLLLPNALVHHSSRLPQQLRQQQAATVTLSGEAEPLSLFAEPVRSQSVDNFPFLLLESPSSPEVQSTHSRAIGSCLWGALCRSKSRQFDRAIRTLTGSSGGSTSFLESTDALLSLLKSETEPTEAQRRVVAKTRRLQLTQICDTTIEEREEQFPLLSPSKEEQHFEFTTAQHLFSSLTYENPLLVSMTSALRGKRSQSYVARSEFDTSYARQQQQQQLAHLRLPDVPPHGISANHRKHRSFTLSSMPRTVTTPQRYGENDSCFPSMWSPPPDKSISASLSPKHARIKSSQYGSRLLANRDSFTLSSSGFALHRSAPNGSYQRVNRYSGSMLDEYGSGDSGGSNSSYRKRFIDQRKSIKTPNSARMSGDGSIMRLGYDSTQANRSSTLPYKRRGSWHVDRESNFSTLDWNTSRNLWSKSRWRSFSPERLALETPHDTGPPPLSSETRSLRSQSLHSKHLLELTKSTEQLSTGFLDNYKGIETSFNALRAKLDAASTDRLYGHDTATEELRRQCKREHRRLLKSLMSDSWEKGIDRQPNPPQPYYNQVPGVVLPVQEATLLTAPRTTNPLTNPNLEKLLRNPVLMQLLANHASQTHQTPDQNSLADQVTLAAVAGAAAATAMANFATPSTEQTSYSNLPVQTTSVGDEYDWNDPETLMAAYTALAEASGGEKAFLEQLSPELAATLVHYREQLSEKLSAGESGSSGKVTSGTPAITTTITTTASVPPAVVMSPSGGAVYDGGGNQSSVVLEDVSRQPGMDKEAIVSSGRVKLANTSLNDATSRIRGMNKNSDSTPTKMMRKTYDFPTKRLLLMRSSKGRNAGGNGFGLTIVGGRQRSDGRLGSYVEQIHSGETLGYLHGEIAEGDEVVEWNGIPLIGKGAAEVQAIVDTPADEVELLVRINPSETLASHRLPQDYPQHTCSRRSPCTADAHRYPSKLCPSHNPNPHFHESLHGGGGGGGSSGGGGGSCMHQQHTCQQSQQPPRGPPIHTCEVHPMGPACIHKQQQQQQHVCHSGEWSSDPRGTYSSRGVIDQPAPNSPQSERNISEASASPSTRPGSVRRQQRQVVPTVNVAEYDGGGGGQEALDTVSHNSGGPINDDGHFGTDGGITPSLGEIELILTFDDYDQSLTAHVARARGLRPMDLNGLADPFVKLRLHPDPTEDMDLNRQIKYIPNTLEPEWQQTVVFMNCLKRTLKKRVLEATVWDFDRLKMNDFMGQAIIHLGSKEALDGQPHWYKLHALQDIVIPGYRQPGTRSVAPPISQNDQVKTIKLVKEIKTPQAKNIQKGRSH